MRIAVDAMGGDHAPDEIVRGAIVYRESGGTADLVLVGRGVELQRILGPSRPGITVVEAADVVAMHEHPAAALRRRTDTSIGVATTLVKRGEADAVVSAGNTGATVAAALLTLGRVKGIDRPALCGMLPTSVGKIACILDVGATPEAQVRNLVEYAVMASRFLERVHGVARPTVGLLNMGEEPEKGDRLRQETHAALRATNLAFQGNVEGRDVMRGTTDIVVCDGFTGNVLIKGLEGAVDVLKESIRDDIFGGVLGKVAYLAGARGVARMRRKMDYEPFASAPLLGVDGVSVVTHGRARANMMRWAISVAERAVASRLVGSIAESAGAASA